MNRIQVVYVYLKLTDLQLETTMVQFYSQMESK